MNSRIATIPLLLLLPMACVGEDEVGTPQSTQRREDALINGTLVSVSGNPNVAALFHMNICVPGNRTCTAGQWYWFPRPCTATILRSQPGQSWVLTARHCVTETGAIDGTLVSPGRLRLNPSVSPGIADPLIAPRGFDVDRVYEFPYGNGSGRDAVLLKLASQLPLATNRLSIARESDMERPLTAYGYGRAVPGESTGEEEDGTTGAGKLRMGSPFWVASTAADGSWYTVNSRSPKLWRGDSGGPSFIVASELPFYELTGVHSTASLGSPSSPAWTADFALDQDRAFSWIQEGLGHLYLSPHSSPTRFLGADGGEPRNGGKLVVQPTGDAVDRRWVHTRAYMGEMVVRSSTGSKHYLTAGLDPSNARSLVLYLTPYSALPRERQTWSLDSNYRIRSDMRVTNMGAACLQHEPDDRTTLVPCSSSARQRWSWRPQP